MEHAVVYFDGVCNFCNGIINFIIRNDRNDYIRYTPLQSEAGQKFLRDHQFPTQPLDTFYLKENGKIYSHSTAVLRILKYLGWKYAWMNGFVVVPAFIRDFFYGVISRNRYRWFGRKDQCMIPTAEERSKFLF